MDSEPAVRPTLWYDASRLPADAGTVNRLARLALVLGRHGAELRLCGPSRELLELIDFVGLADVLRE